MTVYKTEDIETEISTLKSEAVELLNRMFNIPEGYSNKANERLVECIISAAILEITNLNVRIMKTAKE